MSSSEKTFVVERLLRVVFRVTGERPLAYLQDVLAQEVGDLAPGRGAIAAALTPNGRVAAEVRVLPLADSVLLDAEIEAREGILEQIAKHAPLAGCEVSEVSGEIFAAAIRGVLAEGALASTGLPVPASGEAAFARDGEILVIRVAWGVPGFDLIGPAPAIDAALARIPSPRATVAELDGARVRAGRPRFGADVNEELLVNETPLLVHGVSMTKGCYPGQETVARINNLGHARRALRGLRSTSPLENGADVALDGTVVGRVTSSGGSVAIALLKEEVAPGTSVSAGSSEAVVTELP